MSDLISRADAIDAVCRTRCGDKAKGCPAHSCLVIEEFDAILSAETHEIRTETHGVCLISKDDAMGAVQDHFNANGFKGYDDGQKMMDRIKALPSAELPKGDLISRADVLKYPIRLDHYDEVNGDRVFVYGVESVIEYVESLPSADATVGDYPNDLISRNALMEYCSNQKSKTIDNNDIARFPSADAVPTVIRAKTFMRKEDFDKWAEDIKKQNKSIVCIPCDAEVVSADAVQGEWVEIEDYNGDYHYQCSVCKDEFYLEYGTPKENGYAYCPSCGARMKGGAE